MKYFGGCDVGSTYTKAVILDENGKMLADTTIKSKINSEQSAIAAMDEVLKKVGLNSSKELAYL
ncbi:MAG: activase, partial [Oscillospiraceae bacterium]|nr:activase [Oscillospiraceae bacterium]MBR3475257.1 activase [Oscillospiraceae bacterium]MBR3475348.1 activase [Oscillospiraceae bacterium]